MSDGLEERLRVIRREAWVGNTGVTKYVVFEQKRVEEAMSEVWYCCSF